MSSCSGELDPIASFWFEGSDSQKIFCCWSSGRSFAESHECLNFCWLNSGAVLQEKTSRIDRIVAEHQLFSQGLKELQNWVLDTSHMLQTYCAPTADKSVLDSRMIKLEVRQVSATAASESCGSDGFCCCRLC